MSHNPVDRVIWVPIEKVHANAYNPNTVAQTEMELLYLSIAEDGYTQPVVTYYDPAKDAYEVVDGFHRYLVMKTRPDIAARNHGLLPVVVIDKPLANRMASTIRHNRARGKHTVNGMSALVIGLLNLGWSDSKVCREIGMEKEELRRLKHVTGYAKFFLNAPYSRAEETQIQIEERLKYEGRQ